MKNNPIIICFEFWFNVLSYKYKNLVVIAKDKIEMSLQM